MPLTKTIPFDIDAQRFIFAAGLVRFADKKAVDYLVKGLKTNGLWAKMAAVYPMVGGNSWSCKFNLMKPIDSNLAFRLSFVANPTISYNGVDWNGSTQYANTFLTPSSSSPIITQNSCHFSYYSRENVQESSFVVGATDGSLGVYSYLALRQAATGNTNIDVNSASSSATTVVNTDSRGFYTASRINATQCSTSKNGVSTTTSNNSNGLPALAFFLGARNNAGSGGASPSNLSTQQCAFASIGSGLSETDCFNFYNIVQQFQIIINRAV